MQFNTDEKNLSFPPIFPKQIEFVKKRIYLFGKALRTDICQPITDTSVQNLDKLC